MYDVAIIGGGIAGCACAYRLARCRVRVILLEKENDICMGATRANSAIMHAGYDPHPGTLMAKLNVKGNAMSREICKKLHVSWKDTGSLVVALNDEDMDTLQDLLERGRENGVPGLELWDAAQVRAKEPNVTEPRVLCGRLRQPLLILGSLVWLWPRWRCKTVVNCAVGSRWRRLKRQRRAMPCPTAKTRWRHGM